MCLHVRPGQAVERVQLGLWDRGEGACPPAGGTVPLGLSYAHKCPEVVPEVGSFRSRVPLGGGCARITEIGSRRPSRSLEGFKRGTVAGFSRGSRLRMMELLQSIDRSKVKSPWFVTLTVPLGECDWRGIEVRRRKWLKRFERAYPLQAVIIWKKEPHRSGTPHLHGLLFWLVEPPPLKAFREWNDGAWAGAVKSANPHHKERGCRVEVMRHWNGVAYYAAKYLSKSNETDVKETGRIWGIHNRKLLAITIREDVLAPEVGKRVRRTLRKLQERKKSHWEERVQRKDGSFAWVRVRPLNGRIKRSFGGFDFVHVDVPQQLKTAKRHGRPIRFIKGRALSRRVVPIWGDVTVESSVLGGVKKVEKIGEEITSFAPGLHFVDAAAAIRLVEYFKGRVAADLVESATLPF